MRNITLDERRALLAISSLPQVSVGVVEITNTQLEKSIIDATKSVRDSFLQTGFHNYDDQPLGQNFKVQRTAFVYSDRQMVETSISLYRPETKSGDPRLWIFQFNKLSPETQAGDLVAIAQNGEICIAINVSRFDIGCISSGETLLNASTSSDQINLVGTNAERLLQEFRILASRGPIPSFKSGSTAVGHAIETALNITQNSSKDPDKYGIEIKASRHSSKTRVNLFAQVPAWKDSTCKSSAEILDRFGYVDDKGRHALRCTVSALSPNTQGLFFEVDFINSRLNERHRVGTIESEVANWKLEKLRERLASKHYETFWVDAEELQIDGDFYFRLRKITHTRSPNLTAFAVMIEDGSITMDHVMKRNESGAAEEKGPLFKIWEKDLPRLFTIVGEYEFS